VQVLRESSGCKRLLYAQHVEREGRRFFAEVCSHDLEGIVAKRKLDIYKDDGNSWLKIKSGLPYTSHIHFNKIRLKFVS